MYGMSRLLAENSLTISIHGVINNGSGITLVYTYAQQVYFSLT